MFPLLLGSVLVAGLFFSNPLISSALLGLVSLTLLWLVALSWPLLTSPQRLIRTLLIAALIFYAISRATGSV